ncbi:MAG: ArnT family glycosyltransferase [Thermodesulfovibrionales bacterium]
MPQALKQFFRTYIFILPLLAGLAMPLVFLRFVNYEFNPADVNDQGLHQRIAANLVREGAFSGATGPIKPFCPVRPPLYPLLLALIMKLSGSSWFFIARAIQVLLHLATIWLIGRIAICLYDGSRLAAFTAALAAALIPHTALIALDLMSETLSIFLLAASVFLVLRAASRRGYADYILLGICAGFLILARPVFMLLLPVLWAYLLLRSPARKEALLKICISAAAVIILMLPWMIGSTRVLHQVRAFQNTGVGFNLMGGIFRSYPFFARDIRTAAREIGTDPAARELIIRTMAETYLGSSPKDIDLSTAEGRRLIAVSYLVYADAWREEPPDPELVMNADLFLKKAATVWIRSHPGEYLPVLIKNLEYLLIQRYQPDIYQDLLQRSFQVPDYFKYVLYALFLGSVIASKKKGRTAAAVLPLLVVLYLVVIYLPMGNMPRYFFPAYPLMALTLPILLLPARPKELSGPL